ncbi:MAG: PDZ domain-containing protein, partial [Planctomycetes bacterium]|nr:PDZ domain-containing protein [Planctomycetota bacterium]
TDVDLPAARARLAGLPADKEASFEIDRDDQALTIALVPTIKGKVEGEELDCPRWNMTVKTINKFENPDLYFVRKEGVFIFGVKFPGNAASSGLRRNDIITKIDDKPVNTLEDTKTVYESVVDAKSKRTRITLEIIRGGITRQAVLDFSREYKSD